MSRKPEHIRSCIGPGHARRGFDGYRVNGKPATRAQYRRALSIILPTGPRWPMPKRRGARGRKAAIDGRRRFFGCYHDYAYREDWEGDPGVIGGTHTLRWLECTQCGAQLPASYEDAPCYDDYDL